MPSQPTVRALFVIAGSINYYYDVIAYRMADAVRNLGGVAAVATLQQAIEQPPDPLDWVLYVNPNEVGHGFGDLGRAVEWMARLNKRAKNAAAVLLECVKTSWFNANIQTCRAAGLKTMIDLGFHDQRAAMRADHAALIDYHFMFNGLNALERQKAQSYLTATHPRPIPWTFIGHMEKRRVQFVERLLNGLQKDGFVYLPTLTTVTEDGPHINGAQLQAILERTRYYIWVSHHDYFYVESERFRNAILAGAVPVKVQNHTSQDEADTPFTYLMIDEDGFEATMAEWDFAAMQCRYIQDFCGQPTLEGQIAQFFALEVPAHAGRHP